MKLMLSFIYTSETKPYPFAKRMSNSTKNYCLWILNMSWQSIRFYRYMMVGCYQQEIGWTLNLAYTKLVPLQMNLLTIQSATHQKQLWTWTQSPYIPYPGYQAFSGALGEYNGKFMCNQQVLRGGCFATPVNHYRPTYRNFYFPHQNWMFSGICLAKDK